MDKIVCPNCQKEVRKQAVIQIPMTELLPSVPFPLSEINPRSKSGVSEVSLVHGKDGYYVVLETVCKCPFCNIFFEVDLKVKAEPIT